MKEPLRRDDDTPHARQSLPLGLSLPGRRLGRSSLLAGAMHREKEPTRETLEAHALWNDTMARRFDPDALFDGLSAPLRWLESARLRLTADALDARSTDTVLDVGCGNGRLLPLLTAHRVVGLDPSALLLAKARAHAAALERCELVRGFGERLPFGDYTFDRIVCAEVLGCVEAPELVLRELHRVARPGARVVLTVGNESVLRSTPRWVSGAVTTLDAFEQWRRTRLDLARLLQLTREGFTALGPRGAPAALLPCYWIVPLRVEK